MMDVPRISSPFVKGGSRGIFRPMGMLTAAKSPLPPFTKGGEVQSSAALFEGIEP
jgi:hypothetical protein